MQKIGMIVLGHGSRSQEVGACFEAMVGRVAELVARSPDAPPTVLPAFFSLGRPTLAEQVRALAGQGFRRIIIMQYFLYNGVHIERDIPDMVRALRQEFPEITLTLLPTLQDDPAMERLVAERLITANSEESA